jgi:SPP1 family predicted phage head-tail adaptor
VTLQQRAAGSPQQHASGEPDDAWSDVATLWAAVEPLAGRELFAAQQHHSEVTGRIRIRYRAGVTAAMRFVFEERVYNIVAQIDSAERHRELAFLVAEGVNDG